MRQTRYWIKLLHAFFWKFKGLLLASAVLGTLLLFFTARAPQIFPSLFPGETIGMVGRFSAEDIPLSIQSEVSIGLTQIDEEGTPIPGLAESWSLEEEGRVWVFKLGDYKWQDGREVVAKDINYKFTDVEIEVIDEKTLKFILKDPFAPFPNAVSRPVFKRGLLGIGDWKVVKLSLIGDRFIQSIKLFNTKTKAIRTFKFYPTEEAVRLAFKLGEVEKIKDIVDPKDIQAWKNVETEAVSHKDRYVGVFLNTQDHLLSDKSLRQTLAYAINKENFSEERAISPISPLSWAFNPQVKQYPYNPQRGRELLNSLPAEQRNNLSLNLVTSPTLLPIADKIKSDWEAIGIKSHLQVLNTPPSDFQTLLAIQTIPPDPDQYSLWHSTQIETNITNYRNSRESQRIDKLLEDGRRILDQEERRGIYLDFQRFLLEESPVIFLFHPVTYTISKK